MMLIFLISIGKYISYEKYEKKERKSFVNSKIDCNFAIANEGETLREN